MSYNITVVGNSSGFLEVVQNLNTELMFGWFGVLMLIAIGGILFIAFVTTTNSTRKSFAATAFICFALSIILRAVELVPDKALLFTLIFAAIGVAVSRKE